VPPRPWGIAAITVVVLIIASYTHEIISRVPAYGWLHSQRPFYVAESIDKIGGAAVCLHAVWLLYCSGLRGISRELGLSAPVLPAIALTLIASSPMLIGFAITRSLTPHIGLLPLLCLTVLSPFVEEIEFRGFGVTQLQR
jgi:membrane protease YdiL (CAAX protease family)